MGLSWFCKHNNYEVLGWKYVNIGKPDQHIEARVMCKDCGKVVIKEIDRDKEKAFAAVYDDKFGL